MLKNTLWYGITNNSMQIMQSNAENRLNPLRYHLSNEAKKRLRWMYIIYYECDNNVSRASKKIGISREWLSKIRSKFEKHGKDPRSLEPESKAPCNTSNRERISEETEEKIVEIRGEYGWGEGKIETILKRDYDMKAGSSTVNRYLHKHGMIDPELSRQGKKAWQDKIERGKVSLQVKYRPPNAIKDYIPGALIEKDMKHVPKITKTPCFDDKYHSKDYFYFQHTFIDSFTRIRAMELSVEPDSLSAKDSFLSIKQRMPFEMASVNTDNGGENGKCFSDNLQQNKIIQFYSRTGTPTDNPRVERSHLTDEKEFYKRGNVKRTFEKQKEALKKWEYVYNYIRPHQALGNLTPVEFYKLWKKNPEKAHRIAEKYRTYLKRQSKRLANSRKMKKKEQIDKLMMFIDAKLRPKSMKKAELKPYILELVKCELCSWG